MRTFLASAATDTPESMTIQIMLGIGVGLAMFLGHFGMRFSGYSASGRTADAFDYTVQTVFFSVVIAGCLLCEAAVVLATFVYGSPWILFALAAPVAWLIPHIFIYRDIMKTRPSRLS